MRQFSYLFICNKRPQLLLALSMKSQILKQIPSLSVTPSFARKNTWKNKSRVPFQRGSLAIMSMGKGERLGWEVFIKKSINISDKQTQSSLGQGTRNTPQMLSASHLEDWIFPVDPAAGVNTLDFVHRNSRAQIFNFIWREQNLFF